MPLEQRHDIRELPPDPRILAGQRYRKSLNYVAQLAIWIGNLYFSARLLLILFFSRQTWPMWALIRCLDLSRKEQLLVVAASQVPGGGPRKRLRLQGTKNLPYVDILLPCCGEPVDVIMDTVRAACTLDYPVSHFRVLVLDDGGSTVLKKAVTTLQSQCPHLSYHSRGRQSGLVFAKSGNLNYALTTLQREIQPEFCAILDADSIPTRDFLRGTLPHLLLNPNSALVSTRQYFSNLPKGDPLSQARSHFYTCQNAELDILGNAIDAGSGAVFRRKSIVEVGLYPTYSFSEDWQLSLVLHGMGHRTMQVQEPFQYGLVPTSLTGHIAQRNRWYIGHAQQFMAVISREIQTLPKHLQRNIALNGVGIIAAELSCLIGFCAVPCLLLSEQLIPVSSPFMTKLQFLLAVLQVLVTWLYEYAQAAHTGFRSVPFAHLENKWLAGGNIFSILKFYLLTSKPKGSFVTGSTANSWNRNSSTPLYMKLHRDLWQNCIWINVLTVFAILGALFYSTTAVVSASNAGLACPLLTTVTWPPLLQLCYLAVSSNWVPMAYLLNPPKHSDHNSEPCQPNSRILALDSEKRALPRFKHDIGRVGREMLHLGSIVEIGEGEL
ncbi:hypothetical protein N7510_003487 [Penicillium lagena]|uniref:uncharacterized protein n=1 Tax=Penicillium lagena TaxID=94218 RepID=UPI0025416847|nr:uncharacterized protein N7510_003487 [Penicillium lagena]KAJ5619503.1 hypothetical protein N7510_003487 [Penicillium lagena]